MTSQALDLKNKESLKLWTQAKTSDQWHDVIPHFLISFSSHNTRTSYANDLKGFFQFLEKNGHTIQAVSDIQETHILEWQNHLQKELNLNWHSTIRRKLNVLSSFFVFVQKRGLLAQNPMDFIAKPKLKQESKTNAFTRDEVEQILAFLMAESCRWQLAKNAIEHDRSRLQYMVVATLFATGIRVSELCALQVFDVMPANGAPQICIRNAKGNVEHRVFIAKEFFAQLQEFILERNLTNSCHLFSHGKNGAFLSARAVYNIIQKVAQALNIDRKVSPHSCRATVATILHNQGVPIGHIQHLLNHKSMTTTAVYIKKASELREAAATKIDIDGGQK